MQVDAEEPARRPEAVATPPVASFSYAVVQVGDVWKVVCARKAMGHFQERDDALAAASALAAEAVRAGHSVEVLIQSEMGELRPAWRSAG